MFDIIVDALHHEMDLLCEKYDDGKISMTGQDLEHIDKIAHALKCLATYEAMKERPRRSRYDSDYRSRY